MFQQIRQANIVAAAGSDEYIGMCAYLIISELDICQFSNALSRWTHIPLPSSTLVFFVAHHLFTFWLTCCVCTLAGYASVYVIVRLRWRWIVWRHCCSRFCGAQNKKFPAGFASAAYFFCLATWWTYLYFLVKFLNFFYGRRKNNDYISAIKSSSA